MNSAKILIIEDEQKVANFISKGLEEEGFNTDVAYDGHIGLKKAAMHKFDLILLDLNLPGMNGFEVCKKLRAQKKETPVMMLTALGTMDDKLEGFDAGADDYLVKPFEFKELLARIRALLKRAKASNDIAESLVIADLELNADSKIVTRGGVKIDLTAKEFQLLEFLLKNQNKVLSRNQIAEAVWDISFETGTNVIDVYINFLRNKIDKKFGKKLIHTMVGMGYVIREE